MSILLVIFTLTINLDAFPIENNYSDVGIDDSSINQTLVLSLRWFDALSVKRLF
jgi:hypothetical protein